MTNDKPLWVRDIPRTRAYVQLGSFWVSYQSRDQHILEQLKVLFLGLLWMALYQSWGPPLPLISGFQPSFLANPQGLPTKL